MFDPFKTDDREEVRSRLLCKMQGLDPDDRVSTYHPTTGMPVTKPRWHIAREELRWYRRVTMVSNMSVSHCRLKLHEIAQREEEIERATRVAEMGLDEHRGQG